MQLTRNAYQMTIWFIRSYRDLKEKVADELDATPTHNGGGGNAISDPTAQRAAAIEKYMDDIRIIKEASERIPIQYRKAILKNIIDREPYPPITSRKTYGKWKRRFVCDIAIQKGWAMFTDGG